MREKITRFARGNFSSAKAKLTVSEKNIVIKTEEGRDYHGSIIISNDMGISMKGILYSECSHIHLSHLQFDGKSTEIEYTFSTEGLSVSDKINDKIYIISSCGEVIIPFEAEVIIPTVSAQVQSGSVRKISNLNEFAELAKTNSKAAIEVFCSDDFVPVFLYRDNVKELLYKSLIKDSLPLVAMEEFLINTNKKNRVVISIDRNNFVYNNCERNIYDGITIKRSTWGYCEINVSTDKSYIMPERKHINTDRFAGDRETLKFWIDSRALSPGTNVGHIYLDTINRHIEIQITCEVHKNDEQVEKKPAEVWAKYLHAYVGYITDNMDKMSYMEALDEATVLARRYDMTEVLDVIRAYDRCLVDKQYTDEELEEDLRAAENYDEACAEHFILNTDEKYSDDRYAYKEVLALLRRGAVSPLLYYDCCRIFKANPELMHNWSDIYIRPLAWGIKKGMFNAEMAMTFTYHAGRMRQHNNIIMSSLMLLYKQFGTDDTLEVLCSMLIRNNIISESASQWYCLGIEKQLKITRIYESYMESLSENKEYHLPPQVIMYFMYDNTLGDREKAILYACVVRDKFNNSSAYDLYYDGIKEYAYEQIMYGRMNKSLAVIYSDIIKPDEITSDIAYKLPNIMFMHEFECINPRMKKVCVVTEEVLKETITPINDGKALINLYSDNSFIFLIDEKGNRYLNDDFTINSLMRYGMYTDKCYEINKEDAGLLTYMYIRCLKEYHTDDKVIDIRHCVADRLELLQYSKNRNMSVLIDYYYNNSDSEKLDMLLENTDISTMDSKRRASIIEKYIVRGMYDKALSALSSYGIRGISLDILSRFCNDMIEDRGVGCFDDAMVFASYKVFDSGRYSDNILRYLVAYYIGPYDNMMKLYKAAKGFDISTGALAERLIVQSVFCEIQCTEVASVLKSYFETEWDKDVARAFACHMAYRYITDDWEIDDFLWYFIRDNMIVMQNTCCILAALKYLSKEEKLTAAEQKFVSRWLSEMYSKGIVLDFFASFAGGLGVSPIITDMQIMQYTDTPGKKIGLMYCTNNNTPDVAEAKEVYYGIYVSELAVFVNEQVVYEFFEEKGGKKEVLKSGKLMYSEAKSTEVSRFRMINDMIISQKSNDIEGLYDRMECYIRLDEAAKKLFHML